LDLIFSKAEKVFGIIFCKSAGFPAAKKFFPPETFMPAEKNSPSADFPAAEKFFSSETFFSADFPPATEFFPIKPFSPAEKFFQHSPVRAVRPPRRKLHSR
jgi:hypothetical protein